MHDDDTATIEVIADAMIRATGSRKAATAEAEKRCSKTKHDKAEWKQVRDLLRSGAEIPAHHVKLDGLANPHEIHYERISFARGGAVEAQKATKAEAHYRPGNARRYCEACTMFRYSYGQGKHHDGTCTSVAGEISPMGLCDYFKSKSAKGHEKHAEGGSVLNQVGEHAPGVHVHYERVPLKRIQ